MPKKKKILKWERRKLERQKENKLKTCKLCLEEKKSEFVEKIGDSNVCKECIAEYTEDDICYLREFNDEIVDIRGLNKKELLEYLKAYVILNDQNINVLYNNDEILENKIEENNNDNIQKDMEERFILLRKCIIDLYSKVGIDHRDLPINSRSPLRKLLKK